MKISTTNAPAAELEADALILGISEDADKPTCHNSVEGVQ